MSIVRQTIGLVRGRVKQHRGCRSCSKLTPAEPRSNFVGQKGRNSPAQEEMYPMRSIAALVSAAGLLSAALIAPASAQQAPLKIGVLSDFSSVYSDIGGQGNVEATKMAIEDFGGQMFGKPIDMI